MKKLKKQLPSKARFNQFFQLHCSSFRLKQSKGLRITKNGKEIKLKGSGASSRGKIIPKSMNCKIFDTNSNFYRKQRITRKVFFIVFKRILLGLTKSCFWQNYCTLAYHCVKFRRFLNFF